MRRNFIICLLLAGITLGIYWPASHFDLVCFDDPLFVTLSPEINSGLTGHSLVWIFTAVIAANWHPVTDLTFLFTHQFWGASPGAEHVVNALFHAANAVLLFLLLNGMTRAPWRSALAAALFAWHPLRVESVAWIAERKDVLSGFFFLLTLMAYARHARLSQEQKPGARASYGWSLLFFSLGLMSKAMLVTVPAVLLLLDVWPLNRVTWPLAGPAGFTVANFSSRLRVFKPLILEKWPFYVLTAGLCALTYFVQQTHAAVSSLARTGWDMRLGNVILSYVRYLGKTLWPADLAVLYPFPVNENSYLALWPAWGIGLAAAALLGFSGWCCRQLSRRPWLAVGWFWYLIMMLPVIGLVQVGGQGMADRYTYLPMIGPVIAGVWTAAEFLGAGWGARNGRIAGWSLGLLLLGGCAWATANQLQYWRDTVALFTQDVAVTGDNYMAQLTIGYGHEHEERYAEAMEHYGRAIDIYPTDKLAYKALAALQAKAQDWPEAVSNYAAALNIDPGDTDCHLGMATALPHLGRDKEAAEHLEAVLRGNMDSPDVLNNLAWILAASPETELRDGPRAVQLAERACALTYFQKTIIIGTLAAAYAEAGRFDDAIATAQRACACATAHRETGLLARNQELLALYQRHQPYHEPGGHSLGSRSQAPATASPGL
jgi:Flp pilus assembly protein TadD